MVRRGLSLEEKREKILNIYHSTKKIYSLKEIEKAASKQGVTSVTVKVQQQRRRRYALILYERGSKSKTLSLEVHTYARHTP